MDNKFPHLRLRQKSIKMQTVPGSEHKSKLQMPVWVVLRAGRQNCRGVAGQEGSRAVKQLSSTGLAERVQAQSSKCLLPSHFHVSALSEFIWHLEPHWWLLSSLLVGIY